MAFKDLLNKGINMLSSGANAAKDAAIAKRESMQEFDLLKTRSDHIGPMNPYEEKNGDPQPGKEQMILNACLTISVENSKVVNKLIPIDETVVALRTAKEAKTEIDYIFVITDKRLWILNKNEYMIMEFGSISDCCIINKGLLTQGVNFGGNAFYFDGSESDVTKFISILMDDEIRRESTSKAISYLCGISPIRQILNINLRGISLGANGELVMHNATLNQLTRIQDVMSVQILINDTVALMRGRKDSQSIVNCPQEARKMSVKVILSTGEFVIEVMPQTMMNTSYRREESTFINNYNFCKNIVEAIANLIKEY